MSKAIFLGTFDPPHLGHYNCVKSVINSNLMGKFGIDKIHIIPTSQNPNKPESTNFIYRYKMCEMMFRDLVVKNQVMVDDIERDIEHNYTYEIIDYFHSNEDDYIKDDFWWIITTETLDEIVNKIWVNSDHLLKNNKFFIITSSKDDQNYVKELAKQCKYSQILKLKGNIDCHSSDIRNRYKNGDLQILDYTNQEVKKYIIDNKLYLE